MHSYNADGRREQKVSYALLWDQLIHSRVLAAAGIAALIAFFTAAGQPDAWRWFLLAFAGATAGLLLLAWLLGEVVIAAIAFIEEWRDLLTSDL